MPQKYAIQRGSVWHKSWLESRDFYRKYGIRTPFYGIRTPLLCHMNRFYGGWGVVFNLLRLFLTFGATPALTPGPLPARGESRYDRHNLELEEATGGGVTIQSPSGDSTL